MLLSAECQQPRGMGQEASTRAFDVTDADDGLANVGEFGYFGLVGSTWFGTSTSTFSAFGSFSDGHWEPILRLPAPDTAAMLRTDGSMGGWFGWKRPRPVGAYRQGKQSST
jgi:hypothetical protein